MTYFINNGHSRSICTCHDLIDKISFFEYCEKCPFENNYETVVKSSSNILGRKSQY